jgi:crossover junction endodeoxyribonuclease RuvC
MKSAWSQSKRIYNVHIKLEEIVAAHRPEVLVVETLFYGENVQSLIKLGQIRGVILLLGEMHGMEVYEYAPREIKKGMTGYGRAEKGQVIHMVRAVLNLPDLKSPDQADALAVALYHSHLAPTGVSMK